MRTEKQLRIVGAFRDITLTPTAVVVDEHHSDASVSFPLVGIRSLIVSRAGLFRPGWFSILEKDGAVFHLTEFDRTQNASALLIKKTFKHFCITYK